MEKGGIKKKCKLMWKEKKGGKFNHSFCMILMEMVKNELSTHTHTHTQ